MKKHRLKALFAAFSSLLTVLLALWWLQKPKPAAQNDLPAAPNNPAHERASLEEQLKKMPAHGPVLMRLAQLDLEAGKPSDARKWLEQLVAAEPGNSEALLELGRVCYEAGDVACAETQTAKLLEKYPGNPDALYNLGAIAANHGDFVRARSYWEQAVQSAPQSDGARKAGAGLQALRAK